MCTFQRCCERFRDVVHVPSSCARFIEAAHVSRKLCTLHKPPNNVRVQLHWGDQTRSPELYMVCIHYIQHTPKLINPARYVPRKGCLKSPGSMPKAMDGGRSVTRIRKRICKGVRITSEVCSLHHLYFTGGIWADIPGAKNI